MLFTTASQGWLFLIFASAGMMIALLSKIKLGSKKKKKRVFNKKNILSNIGSCLFVIGNCLVFWWLNLKLNYGEVRFYLILAYVVGFYIGNTFFALFNKNHESFDKMLSR